MTEDQLREIESRCNAATPGPWIASIENRDHTSGESVISRGERGQEEDLYLHGGTVEDYDFVANARQDIPILIAEVRRLASLLREPRQSRTLNEQIT
jgi:hypothetical protein